MVYAGVYKKDILGIKILAISDLVSNGNFDKKTKLCTN